MHISALSDLPRHDGDRSCKKDSPLYRCRNCMDELIRQLCDTHEQKDQPHQQLQRDHRLDPLLSHRKAFQKDDCQRQRRGDPSWNYRISQQTVQQIQHRLQDHTTPCQFIGKPKILFQIRNRAQCRYTENQSLNKFYRFYFIMNKRQSNLKRSERNIG